MSRVAPPFAARGRPACGTFAILLAALGTAFAQVPGPNVNMVSIDKYLQKQNEVDVTISPRDPCHIVGAVNDYRTVNNRGLNADGEIGDSWIGVYVSTDCGVTWLNYIMPGYVQGYAGADPMPRFGPGGGLYISHIQFSRSSNFGYVSVGRYLDYNDKEGVPGPPTGVEDQHNPDYSPVRYLGTTIVARGSAGQFLDKPSIAVAPGSGPACSVTNPQGQVVTIPSTNVYVAWTELLGNSPVQARTKIYFARSTDCGQTLAGPATKLSEGEPINQGTVIAVHPTNANIIYVAWRQVAGAGRPDAIFFAMSSDGGRSFTRPAPVPGLSAYAPFDQFPTTPTTFRTLGYPTMVVSDAGRAYLAVSARVGVQVPGQTPGTNSNVQLPEGRILVTSTTNGVSWEAPVEVESQAAGQGHQIMPAIAYAAGKLNLIWYDLRYDKSNMFKAFVDERDVLEANQGNGIRHTLDVRGALASVADVTGGWPLTFNAYGISQTQDPNQPRISQYVFGALDPEDSEAPGEQQRNFNRPNLKLYAGGQWPFIGDYIGVAALQWLPPASAGGPWRFNGTGEPANTVLRTFHGAWTDNRDAIVGPAADNPSEPNSNLDYTPPGSGCVPGKASSRNANVYTSRITPGLYISILGNTKPTDTIERSFAVQIENETDQDMSGVTLSLTPDAGVVASLTQCLSSPCPPPVLSATVDVGRLSTVARTVYVQPKAGTPYPRVRVQATHGGLSAAAYINGDAQNPPIQQPSNTGDPITSKDTHNPRVANPRVANDNPSSPRVANPRVANENVKTPRVENPRVANENPKTPRVANPRVANPRVANEGLANAPFSDVTFDVTNDGNTTSAFRLDVRVPLSFTSSYAFQLLGWRAYRIPIDVDCALVYTEEPQLVFNVPSAAAAADDEKLATAVVRPGETLKVTLRAVDTNTGDGFQPFCNDPTECLTRIEVTATAQAVNTGETAPRTSSVGSIGTPDLVIEGTPSISGPYGSGETVNVFQGESITVTNSVVMRNIGTAPTSIGLGYAYYLVSTADVLQRHLIGSVGYDGPGIVAGGSYTIGPSGPLVANVPLGSYRLEIVADYQNQFVESNEANNASTSTTQTIVVNSVPAEELVELSAGPPSR